MDITTVIEGMELAEALVIAVSGSHLISEILPHIKKVKANSTFQLGFNIMKALLNVFVKKPSNRQD